MQETGDIAVLASVLPRRSETFVWSELRALRACGFAVHAVSLREPEAVDRAEVPDVAAGGIVVYARSAIAGIALEAARHPLRALGTLGMALGDALGPRERLGAMARLKLLPQALFALSLARRLRQRRVGHLHCHFAHAPSTVGMYAARQMCATFSFAGHANDLFERRALLRRKLERAAFVACISEWHKSMYAGVAPGCEARLRLVRCGVDTQAFETQALDTQAHEPPLNGAGKFHVVAVCRLVEKKGIDTLLRAVHELRERYGKVCRCTVAGNGPELARLRALARELGVEVAWLGAVRHAQVRELLAEADVMALPCREDARGDRDGIPVALMEAMACGLPVVAGDLPAIRELVEEGESGHLVHDASELAQRLASLMDAPQARRAMGRRGRARVEAEFSLDANVARLADALRGCER